MKLQIDIQPHLDYIVGQILEGIARSTLPINVAPSGADQPKNIKAYSITGLAKATGHSRASIRAMLQDGLPFYQTQRKKMIRLQDFRDFINERYRVQLEPEPEEYGEFEKRIRKAKQLGDKLWREYVASGNDTSSLSQFSLWLWENHRDCLRKNLIIHFNPNNNEKQ